jgi:ADP-heptose:LPS heptosyltransferase
MKNILIIRSGGMGDALFITPALSMVRNNFPKAKISLLIPFPGPEVLRGNQDVDQIIERPPGIAIKEKYFLSKLKSFNFDLLINLDPREAHNYRIWARAININSFWSLIHKDYLPVNLNQYDFKNFIWHTWDTNRHFVENYLDLLKAAGLKGNSQELKINIESEESNFVDKLLQDFDIGKNDLLIGFHPGTANTNNSALGILFAKIKRAMKAKLPIERRRWPLKCYAELANLLKREFKCKIIITGSENERGLVKQIQSLADFKLIGLSGKTTIKQMAALYKKCDIVIASDTGPLHLSAAVGTPVVGLYGPSSPAHSRPWIEKNKFKITRSNLKCSPCQHIQTKICLYTECMRQIKPQEVFGAVRELINTYSYNGKNRF